MNSEKIWAILVGSILVLILLAVYSLVSAFFAMLCWNYAMVGVFGVPTITFFQAWALMYARPAR